MKWTELYNIAKERQHPREISPFIEAGGVSAAVLTKKGNVYVGICIDTSCSLGMCAERNAIANMITHGESEIVKLVCVARDGSIVLPCGSCREFLMQLDKNSSNIEILMDIHTEDSVKLMDLIPHWWGVDRFDEQNNKHDVRRQK